MIEFGFFQAMNSNLTDKFRMMNVTNVSFKIYLSEIVWRKKSLTLEKKRERERKKETRHQ